MAPSGRVRLGRDGRTQKRPPDPASLSLPQVRGWAAAKGVPVHESASALRDGTGFDWLFSIANLSVIPDDVLALPAKGAINFHDGPLPRMAGLNTPVWALLNGETEHGISWHVMEAGIDKSMKSGSSNSDRAAADGSENPDADARAARQPKINPVDLPGPEGQAARAAEEAGMISASREEVQLLREHAPPS